MRVAKILAVFLLFLTNVCYGQIERGLWSTGIELTGFVPVSSGYRSLYNYGGGGEVFGKYNLTDRHYLRLGVSYEKDIGKHGKDEYVNYKVPHMDVVAVRGGIAYRVLYGLDIGVNAGYKQAIGEGDGGGAVINPYVAFGLGNVGFNVGLEHWGRERNVQYLKVGLSFVIFSF